MSRALTVVLAIIISLSTLGIPWSLMGVFWVIPGPIRDLGYSWAARRRYKWFGKRPECRLPTPEEQVRFLT